MSAKPEARTIYLIHIEPSVRASAHYLGICLTRRLWERLYEHGRGHGARLTRRAAELGHRLTLVRTWPADNYDDEKFFKRRGRYRNLCPICQGYGPDFPVEPIPVNFTTENSYAPHAFRQNQNARTASRPSPLDQQRLRT